MNGRSRAGPLLSVEVLGERMRAGGVLIVDCRFDLADPPKAARDYAAGHISGAVHADLDRDLADLSKSGAGRHPLPDEAAFSAVLSSWGWRPGVPVVAYDAAGGALAAARMWWLMRIAGHAGFVLDGGMAAWCAAGLPLESVRPTAVPSDARIAFDAAQLVDFDELEQCRVDPSMLLLDARARNRYLGEIEPIDKVAGHVPGARNRPFTDNLRSDGRFKSAERLADEFNVLLADCAPSDVVHMCGSGVTACHNLLAMEHAGLHGSRLFAPSWSGWIEDAQRPVAVGDEPD
ncbi:MAG: sulfurtransferase [Rhodanobacteraceae bacterium]